LPVDCANAGEAISTMASAIDEDRMKRAILRIQNSIVTRGIRNQRRNVLDG
jgi:hypothetical protein